MFRRQRQTKQFCKRANYSNLMPGRTGLFGTTGVAGIEAWRLFKPSLPETCNFHGQLGVVVPSQQRISIVGDGNFDIGKEIPAPETRPADG